MARILITGASGFIGGYLVAQALANGHAVTAAVRPGSDRTRLTDPRLRFLDLPLGDVATMAEQLRTAGRFDWVVHNAGVTKALSREAYWEGNAGNTRRLTAAHALWGITQSLGTHLQHVSLNEEPQDANV